MPKSQLVSGLEPDTVSEADMREQSGKNCPAAHPGIHPPRGFAPCLSPVPGGGSQWSAAHTAAPTHLLRPLTYSFVQPSIPVPPVQRPAAGFHEGHPGALPHSSHDSATPLSVLGIWTRPLVPEGTCVAMGHQLWNLSPDPGLGPSVPPAPITHVKLKAIFSRLLNVTLEAP